MVVTPRIRVCAIYRLPLGCYGNLIRSDLFIYPSPWSEVAMTDALRHIGRKYFNSLHYRVVKGAKTKYSPSANDLSVP